MGGCGSCLGDDDDSDDGNANRSKESATQKINTSPNANKDQNIVTDAGSGTDQKTSTVEEKKELIVDAAPDEEAATGPSSTTVVRKAIGSMTDAEHGRFWNALRTAMRSKGGPGTSEFFRIASYHGKPGTFYCHHGKETFPGWHRIYMLEMEHALQAADKENGNDGKVFLPYWDWGNNFADGLPANVRKEFAWPDDLFPTDAQSESGISGGLSRANDRSIAGGIRSGRLPYQLTDGLREVQHWRYASTSTTGQYPSLEGPHNSIHVVVGGRGGQMGGVEWAAFDIVFWLHHCNIDRIYERYITMEPDSEQEFESFQNAQRVDLFDAPFEPFRTPNGDRYYPKDTFNTRALGYIYDKIPPTPVQQLRIAPILVIFDNVKVNEFNGKCYQIHVYIIAKKDEEEFKEPQTNEDIDYDNPNYAGFQTVFNRGSDCKTCVKNPPRDIVLDISQTIMRLQLSRYDVKAKVYMYETTGDTDVLQRVEDNEVLPNPRITGPLFEDYESSLNCESENQSRGEVMGLQRYLVMFGYLAGGQASINGEYCNATKQAVKDFQTAVGQQSCDGIACSTTKRHIMNRKRCKNIDPFAANDVKDDEVSEIDYGKSNLSYYVGVSPGYLARDDVLVCFATAFQRWFDVCGLSFNRVEDEGQADIVLSWSTGNDKTDVLRFDGPGGVLGHGGNGFVQFDYGERWTIGLNDDEKEVSDLSNHETWYRGQPKISLYYTAIHEIGHALGLDHSRRADDVMSPWYDPRNDNLTENDIQRIQAIYGGNNAGGGTAP